MKEHPSRNRIPWRRTLGGLALVLFLGAGSGDDLAQVGKNVELYATVFREVTLHYVDEVRIFPLMKAGIKGMLAALDPYSVFIEEADRADIDLITTGSYGGIGISISNRDGRHVVSGFIEEQRHREPPLRLGDDILTVDSTATAGLTPEALRRLLRGQPGTSVSMRVRRPGIKDTLQCEITRYAVDVKTVSVFDSLADGLYYYKLDRFTRSLADDLRGLLRYPAMHPSAKGIILDLRDNPGGLLESAVDVVELFVPRGSLVVSTRGRRDQYTNIYSSKNDPLLPHIPLVVLINQNSASASEICAGAIQDLDRGVVVGARSFGKGLVQNVLSLPEGASLKLTTSKYYIPSGRCIQKTDYARASKDGILVAAPPDSIHSFFTRSGRVVREAGGVEPDVTVAEDSLPEPIQALVRNGIMFDFVSLYINRHAPVRVPAMDQTLRHMFLAYADSMRGATRDSVIISFEKMSDLARLRGYPKGFVAKVDALGKSLREERRRMLLSQWGIISRQLEMQFAYHLGGDAQRFRYRLPIDRPLLRAHSLLSEPSAYAKALRSQH